MRDQQRALEDLAESLASLKSSVEARGQAIADKAHRLPAPSRNGVTAAQNHIDAAWRSIGYAMIALNIND